MKTKKLILLSVLFPGLLHAAPGEEEKTAKTPADKKAPGLAHDAAAPLSEADQKRLTDLASANPIIAVVSLDAGRFTGGAMEHRVKIKKAIKGKIDSNVLFAETRRGHLAAFQDPEIPKVELAPGDYLVIGAQRETINSFPGNHKKSYNYFIQKDGKGHCAWETTSPEASFLLQRLVSR